VAINKLTLVIYNYVKLPTYQTVYQRLDPRTRHRSSRRVECAMFWESRRIHNFAENGIQMMNLVSKKESISGSCPRQHCLWT